MFDQAMQSFLKAILKSIDVPALMAQPDVQTLIAAVHAIRNDFETIKRNQEIVIDRLNAFERMLCASESANEAMRENTCRTLLPSTPQ